MTTTHATPSDPAPTDSQTDPATGAPPAPTVWPSLRARDARALIAFLVDVFGFEARVVYGEGEHVQHAELAWPEGGGVMLGSVRDTTGDSSRDPDSDPDSDPDRVAGPGATSAYVVTDHVPEVHARVVAAGAPITRPLADTDYGSREFSARDPEGNHWSFGDYRGHPGPAAT